MSSTPSIISHIHSLNLGEHIDPKKVIKNKVKDKIEQRRHHSSGMVSASVLQEILKKLEQLEKQAAKAAETTLSTEELEGTTTGGSNTTNTANLNDIFALQGWLSTLLKDQTEAASTQTKLQYEMGQTMEKSLQEAYKKIQEQLAKRAKMKRKEHSRWGRLENFGKLIANVVEMIKAVSPTGLATMMVLAAIHHKSVGSEMRHDLGKIGQSILDNPELGPTLKAMMYITAGIAVISAFFTGGATMALLVLAITLATTINVKGNNLLSFTSEKLGKLCSNILHDCGVPKGLADKIGTDLGTALTLAAVVASVCITGNLAGLTGIMPLVLMIVGMTLGSMSDEIAQDIIQSGNFSDKQKEIIQIATTITVSILSVALTVGGGANLSKVASKEAGTLTQTAERFFAKYEDTLVDYISQFQQYFGNFADDADQATARAIQTYQTYTQKILAITTKIDAVVQTVSGAIQSLQKTKNAVKALRMLHTLQAITNVGAGTLEIAQAAQAIEISLIDDVLAGLRQDTTMLSGLISINNTMITQTEKNEAKMIKDYDSEIDQSSNVIQGLVCANTAA